MKEIIVKNLLEILLSLVLTFNVAAYKLLWNKIMDLEESAEKNSESIDVILKRIFGIEQDPTDEGHIMETEQRFVEIGEKLEKISEKQDKQIRERKKEHEHVDRKISSIIQSLAEEDRVNIDKKDFKEDS